MVHRNSPNLRSNARVIAAVAVGAMLATGLVACGSSKGGTEAVGDSLSDSLITAAKKEGTVSFYTADGDQKTLDAISNAFQKKYGITVTSFHSTNAPLVQRFLADEARGGGTSDALLLSGPTDIKDLIDQKKLAQFTISSKSDYPANQLVYAPYAYPYTSYTYSLAFNSKVVGSTDLTPFSSWDNVFAGNWAGKFGMPDPNVVGGAFNTIWALKQTLGDAGFTAWEQGLAKLKPKMYPSNSPLVSALGSGEITLGYTWDAVVSQGIASGAPLALAYPTPAVSSTGEVGVVASAPHPNAARLFLDWFLSTEGQQTWADNFGSVSANTAVKPPKKLTSQKWYVPPTKVNYAPAQPTAAQKAAVLADFNKIVLGK